VMLEIFTDEGVGTLITDQEPTTTDTGLPA